MAPRPYCLQCQSATVMMDEDSLNGMRSVYCYICGNRQYQGMDYVGFEMREGPMTIRATCKNCGRPDMTIVCAGLCFPCAKTAKANPDSGPERDKALAEVAERAKSMSGPRTQNKPPADRYLKGSPVRPRKAGRKKNPDTLQPSAAIPQRATPAAVNKPISGLAGMLLTVSFDTPEDVKLYDAFVSHCRLVRRTPDQQILHILDFMKSSKWQLVNFIELPAGGDHVP